MMLPELKAALPGLLGGYALCVLLPLPWASGRMLRAWAAFGAVLGRALRSVAAVARAGRAPAGSPVPRCAAAEPLVLHPDTIAALAAAIAAPLVPVRPAVPAVTPAPVAVPPLAGG